MTCEGWTDLPSLEYLNLRETKVENFKTHLETLTILKKLKDLNVKETPMEENTEGDLKKEVLIILETLSLARFNKDEVTPEDVQEAQDLKNERIKEEEERRIQEEEERRQAELEREQEEAEA